MLRCVVQLLPLGDAPGLRGRKGLVQRCHAMRVQVFHHQADHRYVGIGLVHQPAHAVGKVLHGALLGDGHTTPAVLGTAGQEQVTGASPHVFVVLPPGTPGPCLQRRPGLRQELGSGLVKADHRPPGVMGLGLDIQHVLHVRHELPAYLGDALLLLPPWHELFFSGAAAPSRGTWIPPAPTPPSCLPGRGASSGHDPLEPGCKPRISGEPRPGLHLSVGVGRVVAPSHLLQSLLHVPALGAEHRALRDIQSSNQLGSSPGLVCLEKYARPGDCLGGTPARPDHLSELSLFLVIQTDTVNFLHHGCPSHTTASFQKVTSGQVHLIPDNTAWV